MIAPGRFRATLFCFSFAIFLFWLLRFQYYDEVVRVTPWRVSKLLGAGALANSTLGFGAIIANSAENQNDPLAWRQRGLIAAANRTGIDITIPPQPPLNRTALDILMTAGRGPYPKPGSARAYYAYLNLLEQFLASNLETVLFLEDDVDWELDIRKLLAPRASIPSGIREVTDSKDDPLIYPYGREWDLLYVGHCGLQERKGDRTILLRNQDTVPNNRIRSIFGEGPYLNMPEHTREVHSRMSAMCTFGVAMSKLWVRKFLKNAYNGGVKGFDYAMNIECGYHGLKCVGIRPEIMHQQKAVGGGYHTEIEKVGLAATADGSSSQEEKPEASQERPEPKPPNEKVHFFTFNVKNSARCNVDRLDTDRTNCPPNDWEWASYAA